MSRYAQIITLCLLGSVSLNLYLLWPGSTEQDIWVEASPTPLVSPNRPDNPPSARQAQSGRAADSVPAAHSTGAAIVGDIDTARQWLKDGELALVERFLIDALRAAPESVPLLLLEADFIQATEPLSTAVAHLYALKELGIFDQTEQEKLKARADELVESTISALYNAGDWDVLAQFLEPLFQLNSTEQTLTLKLAEAYARQQKFTLMEDTLANLSPDNAGARSIRLRFLPDDNDDDSSTAEAETKAVANATRVALTRYGDQYIASTEILNRPAALLLDTGASSTAISRELYLSLRRFNNLKVIGLFDVRTAGGTIRSPLVRIDSMTLGPYRLSNIGVFVLPENAMQHADGLLGMNVLKQFHFQVDQNTAELLLSPRL